MSIHIWETNLRIYRTYQMSCSVNFRRKTQQVAQGVNSHIELVYEAIHTL